MVAACGKVEGIPPDSSPVIDVPDTPPVDPFVNGSFEQHYTGWTLNEDSGIPLNGFWGISQMTTFAPNATVHDYNDSVDGVPSCFSSIMSVVKVADGMLAAFNAQSGIERHRIWQDIALPASAKMLTFNLAYTTSVAFNATTQFLAIEVRDPTSDSVLGKLFYTDPTTSPPLTLQLTEKSASLQPYAGRTVRITVDVMAGNDCLFAVVDNFRVTF